MIFNEFKQKVLDYLRIEQELTQRDILNHQDLSDEEKIAVGYLVKNAVVETVVDDMYELLTVENNSKFRTGDKVVLIGDGFRSDATIIENTPEYISVKMSAKLKCGECYDILINELEMFETVINVIDSIEEGDPGSFYIKELCKIKDAKFYGSNVKNDEEELSRFNSKQKEAIEKMLQIPSLYCVQGPPGTGKTDVLAFVAKKYSEDYKNVLVLSNTHQAVNNALNQIVRYGVPTVKIGEPLKAVDLDDNVIKAKNYREYSKIRGRRGLQDKGEIMGMTLYGAIVELALKKSGFYPDVIIVDEAGQVPMSLGVALGALRARSVIFIGDDRQMPPIFHSELLSEDLSISVFTYIAEQFPAFKTVLDTTYRMNTVITDYVSKYFYEPYGIKLISDKNACLEKSIEVVSLTATNQTGWQEYNPEEAEYVSLKAMEYSSLGFDVAVVTPFRKQVNCIKWYIKNIYDEANNSERMPIVDTVERLQGQSVDVIIVSTSVSDVAYYHKMKDFILEPHRLNVMFSRAKEKVLVVKSPIVEISES